MHSNLYFRWGPDTIWVCTKLIKWWKVIDMGVSQQAEIPRLSHSCKIVWACLTIKEAADLRLRQTFEDQISKSQKIKQEIRGIRPTRPALQKREAVPRSLSIPCQSRLAPRKDLQLWQITARQHFTHLGKVLAAVCTWMLNCNHTIRISSSIWVSCLCLKQIYWKKLKKLRKRIQIQIRWFRSRRM